MKKAFLFVTVIIFTILFSFSCDKKNPTKSDDSSNVTDTVTDIDGNVYQTVQIGNQIWMAENLQVTHYRNGDAIPKGITNVAWYGDTGAYCYYGNNASNWFDYGLLYNWYAINDSRCIAPAGWHVPTDEEWKECEMFLGMSQSEADDTGYRGTDEGGKLKSTGILEEDTGLWRSPNTGATNESGFSALPGGMRDFDGSFGAINRIAGFWSSTEINSGHAWGREMRADRSDIYRPEGVNKSIKKCGHSVRCVRD
jgi:uncharacterized protein (TIGR02145 family)